MDASRVRELVAGLQRDHERGDSPGVRLCSACVDLIAVSGAGIMLMDDEGNGSSLGLSDHVTETLEDLQFTLGEGPGIDAHTLGRPVLAPQLDHPVETRWPAFTPAAMTAGVCATFGFPLRVGAIRLGALDLYHDRPGALGGLQIRDAISMADIVTRAIIATQANAGPGELAVELGGASNLRTTVHQASGMISEQLAIAIGDALVRLRAYAYAEGRPVNDVATDVVGRRLRIE